MSKCGGGRLQLAGLWKTSLLLRGLPREILDQLQGGVICAGAFGRAPRAACLTDWNFSRVWLLSCTHRPIREVDCI